MVVKSSGLDKFMNTTYQKHKKCKETHKTQKKIVLKSIQTRKYG